MCDFSQSSNEYSEINKISSIPIFSFNYFENFYKLKIFLIFCKFELKRCGNKIVSPNLNLNNPYLSCKIHNKTFIHDKALKIPKNLKVNICGFVIETVDVLAKILDAHNFSVHLEICKLLTHQHRATLCIQKTFKSSHISLELLLFISLS